MLQRDQEPQEGSLSFEGYKRIYFEKLTEIRESEVSTLAGGDRWNGLDLNTRQILATAGINLPFARSVELFSMIKPDSKRYGYLNRITKVLSILEADYKACITNNESFTSKVQKFLFNTNSKEALGSPLLERACYKDVTYFARQVVVSDIEEGQKQDIVRSVLHAYSEERVSAFGKKIRRRTAHPYSRPNLNQIESLADFQKLYVEEVGKDRSFLVDPSDLRWTCEHAELLSTNNISPPSFSGVYLFANQYIKPCSADKKLKKLLKVREELNDLYKGSELDPRRLVSKHRNENTNFVKDFDEGKKNLLRDVYCFARQVAACPDIAEPARLSILRSMLWLRDSPSSELAQPPSLTLEDVLPPVTAAGAALVGGAAGRS